MAWQGSRRASGFLEGNQEGFPEGGASQGAGARQVSGERAEPGAVGLE